MPQSRFHGPQPPPRRQETTYQVLRPQATGPLDLTLLSNTVRTVATHYVVSDESGSGLSQVCFEGDGGCLYHDDPLEWSGFIPVWDHSQRKKAVLRLAPMDYEKLV